MQLRHGVAVERRLAKCVTSGTCAALSRCEGTPTARLADTIPVAAIVSSTATFAVAMSAVVNVVARLRQCYAFYVRRPGQLAVCAAE